MHPSTEPNPHYLSWGGEDSPSAEGELVLLEERTDKLETKFDDCNTFKC